MKYGYWINHNGVYYAPGTEVPEGKAPSTPVNNEPSEPLQSVEPEPTQNNEDGDNTSVDDSVKGEKAAYTRTQVQQMDKATAQEVATELGVEFNEDMTVKEIKAKIMAKLGI